MPQPATIAQITEQLARLASARADASPIERDLYTELIDAGLEELHAVRGEQEADAEVARRLAADDGLRL